VQGLQEVAALPQEGGYGQVKLLATSVLDREPAPIHNIYIYIYIYT